MTSVMAKKIHEEGKYFKLFLMSKYLGFGEIYSQAYKRLKNPSIPVKNNKYGSFLWLWTTFRYVNKVLGPG